MVHPTDARTEVLTAEEFSSLPEEHGYTHELVRGRVIREPLPKPTHGRLEVRLSALLHTFAESAGLGVVVSNTGFVVATDPDTVRGPDIAFIVTDRIPAEGYAGPYWRLGPDLAAEILTPSNTASAMQEKVLEYLDAGSRLVWVIDPGRRTVTVYRSAHDIHILTAAQELDGEDVLPGFHVALAELFG